MLQDHRSTRDACVECDPEIGKYTSDVVQTVRSHHYSNNVFILYLESYVCFFQRNSLLFHVIICFDMPSLILLEKQNFSRRKKKISIAFFNGHLEHLKTWDFTCMSLWLHDVKVKKASFVMV